MWRQVSTYLPSEGEVGVIKIIGVFKYHWSDLWRNVDFLSGTGLHSCRGKPDAWWSKYLVSLSLYLTKIPKRMDVWSWIFFGQKSKLTPPPQTFGESGNRWQIGIWFFPLTVNQEQSHSQTLMMGGLWLCLQDCPWDSPFPFSFLNEPRSIPLTRSFLHHSSLYIDALAIPITSEVEGGHVHRLWETSCFVSLAR